MRQPTEVSYADIDYFDVGRAAPHFLEKRVCRVEEKANMRQSKKTLRHQ